MILEEYLMKDGKLGEKSIKVYIGSFNEIVERKIFD